MPEDVMPPAELIHVGKPEHFRQVGEVFHGHFIHVGGLQPDEDVLDVGCGIGRMAIPLTHYLTETARYEGFDIVEAGISWCQENITPRHPNFRFRLVELANTRYRGAGAPAERFRFPYPDADFDFVFLTSVFTHMLPEAVQNYLYEIRRVLRPEGRVFVTFFLLDVESETALSQGLARETFPVDMGGCRVARVDQPEAVVAYPVEAVAEMVAKAGFDMAETHPGNWAHRSEWLDYQDILLLKPSHHTARAETP